MFITAPGLVQHLHPSQVVLRQSRWPAVTLGAELPWYLLVHRVAGQDGRAVSQTTLVGRDDTLRDLLACLPAGDVTGLARMARQGEGGAAWAVQWVTALWAAAPHESMALGLLLFQLGADPQLRDRALRPVVGEAAGRQLLFAAAG